VRGKVPAGRQTDRKKIRKNKEKEVNPTNERTTSLNDFKEKLKTSQKEYIFALPHTSEIHGVFGMGN